jgi:hypothetical protein
MGKAAPAMGAIYLQINIAPLVGQIILPLIFSSPIIANRRLSLVCGGR